MASKKTTDKRQPWEVDFVHIELDANQKRAVQQWDEDGSQSILSMENLLLAGNKISLVYDGNNQCTIASLTTPKVEGAGRQMCISARGPDLVSAIRVLNYKIVKILDSNLDNAREVAEARGQWG